MNENNLKKIFEQHDADKEQIRTNVIKIAQSENAEVKRHFRFKPVIAVSICLILIAGSFSWYMITAEAREYKEAISFFNEYQLPADGLTRSEIKSVYKDITMKTYSFEKTKEIINSFSVSMNSTDLGQSQKSYDEMWNEYSRSLENQTNSAQNHQGVWYDVEYIDLTSQEKDSENDTSEQDTKSEEQNQHFSQEVIVKYQDGAQLWRYSAPYDMYIDINDNVIICDDGVIVYGSKENTGTNTGFATVFMISNSGELLWEYSDTDSATDFEAAAILQNEIALFGHQNNYIGHKYHNYDLFTVVDRDGKRLEYSLTESVQNGLYDTAVKIGNDYLVKQYCRDDDDYGKGPHTELISISSEGKLNDKFTYSDKGITYEIQDMIFHNGKVYLSALLPEITDQSFDKQFYELSEEYFNTCDTADSDSQSDNNRMPDDYYKRLKDLFAEQYSAVLLICDDSSVVTKVHSVKNARAGTLGLDEKGRLTWQIYRIDSVKNSPLYLSSRIADIIATEFSLAFDDSEKMVEKLEIGTETLMR